MADIEQEETMAVPSPWKNPFQIEMEREDAERQKAANDETRKVTIESFLTIITEVRARRAHIMVNSHFRTQCWKQFASLEELLAYLERNLKNNLSTVVRDDTFVMVPLNERQNYCTEFMVCTIEPLLQYERPNTPVLHLVRRQF